MTHRHMERRPPTLEEFRASLERKLRECGTDYAALLEFTNELTRLRNQAALAGAGETLNIVTDMYEHAAALRDGTEQAQRQTRLYRN